MPKKQHAQQALAAQIVARQKFLEDALSFVTLIVSKQGKVLHHEVHDYHTETKAELKNFADFSFYTYGAYSMYGGQAAKVWYHPGSEETSAAPVLEVEWWDIKKCQVRKFNPSVNWQRALKALIKNADRVAKETEAKRTAAEERRKRISERDRRLREAEARAQEDAERLGIALCSTS